jgi:uncharacterized protein (DUF58 family)
MRDLFWLSLLLFIVAVVLRSDLFFYLLYVVIGLQVIAWLWLRRNTKGLHWERQSPVAAFPGEAIPVEIRLRNEGVLPMPWLSITENIPATMHTPPQIREVVSLGAGKSHVMRYTLVGRRRGLYQIGPLSIQTGDVLGLNEQTLNSNDQNTITIYPTILSLAELGLPASLPYGTLATNTRLFSDPARPIGVRPYQSSDGVRRIDWKTTAHAGEPQVRRYQPAISLETLIALAFSNEEYDTRYKFDVMERALVAAASIAAHLSERRQPIGLCTTGIDPLHNDVAKPLPIGTGRAHLIEVLATLGRLDYASKGSLPELLNQAGMRLSWGSTVVIITGQRGRALVEQLLPLKRRGLNIALIITEPTSADLGLPRQHGFATFGLWRDGRPSVG